MSCLFSPLTALAPVAEHYSGTDGWSVDAEMYLREAEHCASLDDQTAGQLGIGQDLKKVERDYRQTMACWKPLLAEGRAPDDLVEYVRGRSLRTETRLEGVRSIRALLERDVEAHCEHVTLALGHAREALAIHQTVEEQLPEGRFQDLVRADRKRLENEVVGYEAQTKESCGG